MSSSVKNMLGGGGGNLVKVGSVVLDAIGVDKTIDVTTTVNNWSSLRLGDFYPVFTRMYATGSGSGENDTLLTQSYNASTGIYSVSRSTAKGGFAALYLDIYVFPTSQRIEGIQNFSLIGSSYNTTYTFTTDASNVLICGISGRSGDARSELATTATVDAQGYWRTSGTQGSLALIYCKKVSAGDTVRITNSMGYPSIFVISLG